MVEERPFDPRQRVIGAVILVVLAVVILPILLRRPPSRMKGQDVLTIRRTGSSLTTHWVPGRAQALGRGAGPVLAKAPVLSKKPVGGATAAAAKPPAPAASGAGGVPGQSARAPAPRPRKGGWYVQVGAYVNASDAIAFEHRLHIQGFPAHVKLARLATGHGVVVIVGPYRHNAQALTARDAVARRDKIRGFLIRMAAGAR